MNPESIHRELNKCQEILAFKDLKKINKQALEGYQLSLIQEQIKNKYYAI